MILSGYEIEKEIQAGNIHISDYDKSRLNPNSYNLRLSDEMQKFNGISLDIQKDNKFDKFIIETDGIYLLPNNLYLGKTIEETFTDKYVPIIEGRSSVGRLGLFVHVTAGFGDIGFKGCWTLELVTVHSLIILPYIEICQIYFMEVKNPKELYKGKYNSKEILSSKLYLEINKNKK